MLNDSYCTKCGANLEHQCGFYPSIGNWICERCGNEMTDFEYLDIDDRENVIWFCDECGSCLNKQIGFSEICDEWFCDQCGYENHISSNEIFNSVEEYELYQTIDSIGKKAASFIGAAVAMTAIAMKQNAEYEKERKWKKLETRSKKKTKRNIKMTRLWSAIAHKKMLVLNVRIEWCVGKNYQTVKELFQKNGFSNIRLDVIEDLDIDQIQCENIVTAVMVEGNSNFMENTKARYDSDICITIHRLRRIFPPLSPKEIKRKNGRAVAIMFRKAGFAFVKENVIYDLKFGLLKKDGEIDEINIGGDKKYKKDFMYRIDTEVEINYHTFRRNKI